MLVEAKGETWANLCCDIKGHSGSSPENIDTLYDKLYVLTNQKGLAHPPSTLTNFFSINRGNLDRSCFQGYSCVLFSFGMTAVLRGEQDLHRNGFLYSIIFLLLLLYPEIHKKSLYLNYYFKREFEKSWNETNLIYVCHCTK